MAKISLKAMGVLALFAQISQKVKYETVKTKSNQILIIDENNDDHALISSVLGELDLQATFTHDTYKLEQLIKSSTFFLIIIGIFKDVQLSLNLIYKIRSHLETPIIAMLNRESPIPPNKILEAGANDYMIIPLHESVLKLRVGRVLETHKVDLPTCNSALTWGNITLDPGSCGLVINQKYVPLTRTEFLLVRHLMSKPEQVFPRPELLNVMQVYDGIGSNHLIDTHLSRVRMKIRQNGGSEVIFSHRGLGVRLAP